MGQPRWRRVPLFLSPPHPRAQPAKASLFRLAGAKTVRDLIRFDVRGAFKLNPYRGKATVKTLQDARRSQPQGKKSIRSRSGQSPTQKAMCALHSHPDAAELDGTIAKGDYQCLRAPKGGGTAALDHSRRITFRFFFPRSAGVTAFRRWCSRRRSLAAAQTGAHRAGALLR
ncbi:hypothetical protein Purlil1_13311 [Purpureocillium lilacinum]|uniref:Uncharacterized protein n=1 Tax=Purpureocillium lilacinum TaxID=33203 RepID=A0ABR0BEG2_PURLI|nr:hypothetical protein Purlil1_13311 [Purpureocillium lilacinum]